MRCATATTSWSLSTSSQRTTNSSPPKRAAVSPVRRTARDALGDADQQRVAGLVPVAVVDRLEAVEVEHEQRERGVAARQATEALRRDGRSAARGSAGRSAGRAAPGASSSVSALWRSIAKRSARASSGPVRPARGSDVLDTGAQQLPARLGVLVARSRPAAAAPARRREARRRRRARRRASGPAITTAASIGEPSTVSTASATRSAWMISGASPAADSSERICSACPGAGW